MGASQFSWTQQWYPLAPVDDLDSTRPNAAQLLGRRLVLWRDAGGDWRAFEDLCPHRCAAATNARQAILGVIIAKLKSGTCPNRVQRRDLEAQKPVPYQAIVPLNLRATFEAC